MKLVFLPLNQIEPNPIREISGANINDLRESIKKYGVLQPILVQAKSNTYQIVSGNHRYYAAKGAGLKKIPAIIKNGLTQSDIVLISITENIQRLDLNPWEAGKLFCEALGYFDISGLANKLGKSVNYIKKRIQIYKNLNHSLVEKLKQGNLTIANAYRLSSLPEKAQIKVSEQVEKYRDATENQYKPKSYGGFGGYGGIYTKMCSCPRCGATHPEGKKAKK